ncbi:MAG: proteophosphoglycan precursor [Gammaproteobacteria bacterium]|nr:proteophosphoglycan precursor [Gammaproteobacteria bacterium]|tara:strand:- start:1698 stop:2291 length:594 start_codon:yes stop_codon:yes gene_type:complete
MTDKTASPDNLLKQIGKQKGPAPVHDWDPPYCGEMDMRIAADGRWYHEGTPIGRIAMVRLFSSILRLDEDGHHYLVTPVEKVRIRVDDCPFVAQLLDVSGEGRAQRLTFTLNTGETVTAGADNPITVSTDDDQQPHPVLDVRHGLKALISRSVFYQMVTLADTASASAVSDKSLKNKNSEEVLGIYSDGVFFRLGER